MASRWRKRIATKLTASYFLQFLEKFEFAIGRVLTVILVIVVISATFSLAWTIAVDLFIPPYGRFGVELISIFGLILDVLIAMELLENVSVYLKRNVLQVELVIATGLIAISRKIIVLDFPDTSALKLIGLATAILALALSYWLVRKSSPKPPEI
ncbi:MAG: phosphate-starvation-inducible PsiE family protein [Synechococcus sp.]